MTLSKVYLSYTSAHKFQGKQDLSPVSDALHAGGDPFVPCVAARTEKRMTGRRSQRGLHSGVRPHLAAPVRGSHAAVFRSQAIRVDDWGKAGCLDAQAPATACPDQPTRTDCRVGLLFVRSDGVRRTRPDPGQVP